MNGQNEVKTKCIFGYNLDFSSMKVLSQGFGVIYIDSHGFPVPLLKVKKGYSASKALVPFTDNENHVSIDSFICEGM